MNNHLSLTRWACVVLAVTASSLSPTDTYARRLIAVRRVPSFPTGQEILDTHDKVYAVQVTQAKERKGGMILRAKTTRRYKGKVGKRVSFDTSDPEGCIWVPREELAEDPSRRVGFVRAERGQTLLVLDGTNGCVLTRDVADTPKTASAWAQGWDAENTATLARLEEHNARARNYATQRKARASCGQGKDAFKGAIMKKADLVVAGSISPSPGEAAKFRLDSVYTPRTRRASALGVSVPRVIHDDTTRWTKAKRVLLMLDAHDGSAHTIRGCTGFFDVGEEPFPDTLDTREAVASAQLTCPSLLDEADEIDLVDVAFHARVTSVKPTAGGARVTLDGITVYKNSSNVDLARPFEVSLDPSASNLAMPLSMPGRQALVFGSFDASGKLKVDRCGASRHTARSDRFRELVARHAHFQCTPEELTMASYEAAAVVGHGKFVRVDTSQKPSVAEFVMDGFHKGAELSKEGRVFVNVPPKEVSFQHDTDTLLVLTATEKPYRFELTSCGVQSVFEGAPPVLLGHEPVRYDPKAHASSCATSPPARAPGAPLVLLVLVGGLAWRRRVGCGRV